MKTTVTIKHNECHSETQQ